MCRLFFIREQGSIHPASVPAAVLTHFYKILILEECKDPRKCGRLSAKRKEKMMKPLILQSDFGTADGAVSAMYGVAYGVSQDLNI